MRGSASTTVNGAAVTLTEVSKIYQTREGPPVHALDMIDLEMTPGSFVACVGPSGCGKSTMLSMLAGLEPCTGGRIHIDGEVVNRAHPKVGVVFQTDLLLYWRTVLDNVLLPLEIKKQITASSREQALEILGQVGLEGFAEKYPNELSGGMRQRVALSRALIQEPGLLLMDEPFAALDALTREKLIVDLETMWLRLGNTVLFITHGIDEAVFLADRVIVMSPRPGKIVLDLRIEISRPRKWGSAHEDPKFLGYVRQVRRIFEEQGVL